MPMKSFAPISKPDCVSRRSADAAIAIEPTGLGPCVAQEMTMLFFSAADHLNVILGPVTEALLGIITEFCA